MSLCSHCARHNRVCRVLPDSSESRWCSSCVFYSFKYDVEGVPVHDQATLEKEEERLKAERRIALDTIAAASACLSRLEKQQEFLRKHALEMIRRSLTTLNELDAEEDKERAELEKEKEKSTQLPQPLALDGASTFSFVGLDAQSHLDFLDAFGEIPLTSQGS